MSIKNLIFKQYDVGSWLGSIKNVYGRALSYQSITNIFLIALTAYNTLVLRPEFAGIVAWLNFPLFLGILLLVLLLFMVFCYKIEIPSDIRFGASQSWKHYNPVRDYLFELGKKLDDISERLEKLEERRHGEDDKARG